MVKEKDTFYDKKYSSNEIYSEGKSSILKSIGNFFYAGGSILFSLFLRKQSFIVYDGDYVSMLGIARFNL
jgi:hypothetical protein